MFEMLELATPQEIINYTYDTTWRDKMTAFGNKTITYDAIGNPTKYGDWNMTWIQGRRLASMSTAAGDSLTFAYNEAGIRTKKVDNKNGLTYQYQLAGSKVVGERVTNTASGSLVYANQYIYDSAGNIVSMVYNGTEYYYVKNGQGDIIGLIDGAGSVVVNYNYDSWGKLLSVTGNTTLGNRNPFRYRGYYYDVETGLYYLKSRYYDSVAGKFINADEYPSTGQGITGSNMFAYCDNNPIIRRDATGYVWETVWDIVSLAGSIVEVVANPADPWAWAGLVGDVIDVALPCVGGLGESVDAAKTIVRVVDKGDDIIDVAKTMRRAADAADDLKTAKGTYVVLYDTAEHYIGKGGFKRAITSAAQHLQTDKKVIGIVWAPTSSDRFAFVAEYMLQSLYGVGKDVPSSLNRIYSPGKNYLKYLQ